MGKNMFNNGIGNESKPVLSIGHSPDPDDAFMWFPITGIAGGEPLIDTGRFRFKAVQQDIESLNILSKSGKLEITAISMAQYPYIANQYAFTSCGASMGEGYGPKLVMRGDLFEKYFTRPEETHNSGDSGNGNSNITGENKITIETLRNFILTYAYGSTTGKKQKLKLAIPGERTSAYLGFRLMMGGKDSTTLLNDNVEIFAVAFDEIMQRVCKGEFDLGLVIHEGQLTFARYGLRLLADMGAWWTDTCNLPLPLGANVIRRDLDNIYGNGTLSEVTATLAASLNYALTHRDMAIDYALKFGRGLDKNLADEFVTMYVNKYTKDFGERGRAGVIEFLTQAGNAALCPRVNSFDFIEPA